LNNFREVLEDLNASPDVREIILIDNAPSANSKTILAGISKIQYMPMEQNIYVNPSWNLGVSAANSEYVMILNDDVWTNPSLSKIIETHKTHEDKNNGIYGFSTSCFLCKESIQTVPTEPVYFVSNEGRGTGWGCMFLFKRDMWVDIPDELKIWFGDDYITQQFMKRNQTVYSIKNVCVTEWSVTTRLPEFSSIMENDRQLYFSKGYVV
jgi:hypothetical protein